jgi:acyl carrier protein
MPEYAEAETATATIDQVANIVRQLLERDSLAQPIGRDDDLSAAGLTSADMINLMLLIEEQFRIAIPEQELRPVNFRSIASIDALVRSMVGGR